MPLPTAPFDATKSIFAGLSVIQLKLLPVLSAVTAATTVISKAGHTLVNGQMVQFVSGTGFTGLTPGANYFVNTVVAGVSFGLAATKTGSAIAVGTSTVGVFAPVSVFEVDQLDDNATNEIKQILRPDGAGRLRPARSVETKASEMWAFNLQEVKRLLEIFGGKMRGRVVGTCTIWIPDPDDASGNVSLKSQTDFNVVISRDGKVGFGSSDFSKASVKIESEEPADISWTADGAA